MRPLKTNYYPIEIEGFNPQMPSVYAQDHEKMLRTNAGVFPSRKHRMGKLKNMINTHLTAS